ncbi:MAG: phosphoesterase [Mycobacterium sp.]|nr:phosphoesterase [Mycobacterium sp.]
MGSARNIGRVGALAVALGVGVALATAPGIAYAEPSSGASSVSDNSASTTTTSSATTSATTASTPGLDAASTEGSSTAETSVSEPTLASESGDDDTEDSSDGDVAADVEAEDADGGDVGVDVGGDVVDNSAESSPDGTAIEDTAAVAEPAAADPAPDEAHAGSVAGDSADGEPAGSSAASDIGKSGAVGDSDQTGADDDDASADSEGAATLSGAVADPAAATPSGSTGTSVSSLAAATTAHTPVSADTANSPAPKPTLKDVADGVVRVVAQLTVDVLDWVFAVSGTSYDNTELPWGLAILAAVRREIDETFLAPYRAAQHAAAQAAIAHSPNLLVNPGAEQGDPSLSGNSAVSIPGWTVTGTPTAIEYGTLRNSWPVGTPFPFPDLPSFMGFPKAKNGPTDGGAQFFGGGNVADSTLTQTVDLSAAALDIDTGAVTYNLSAWLGGWLANLSSASVKVDFLDTNRTYLGTTTLAPVGVLERFFGTKLKQRQTSGAVPVGTRYAQVDVILDQVNIFPLGINVNYNSAFADNIVFTISADLPAPGPATPPVSTVGELDHVFMVYMENKGYGDIIGSPNAPFTNSLVNAYGSANNFFALTHPSLPNYYPIVGGTDYGLTYECEAVCIFDHGTILTTNIDNAGMTWRGYAQSQPPGQPLEASGDYSVAQLPFVAFEGIGNDQAYAVQHLFPLDQMTIDLSSPETTPDFVWFAANENYNGEGPIDSLGDIVKFMISQFSPTHQYNVPALDQFLSETVPVILNSNVWLDPAERSVLVVTFDEDNDNLSLGFGDEGNRIVTVVIPSPAAVAGGMRGGHFTATNKYDHYSLLRMIEDSLGLPTLTKNDEFAAPMNEFWT